MATLEDKIDEVVFGSLKLIREYLQMERALQHITDLGCVGCTSTNRCVLHRTRSLAEIERTTLWNETKFFCET